MTEYQLLHLIIHETGFKCLHMCMHVGVCVGRVKETKKRFIKEQRKQKKKKQALQEHSEKLIEHLIWMLMV